MTFSQFTPHHVNLTSDDLAGNNGIGRYVFIPGSDGRAKDISKNFKNVVTKKHERGHNAYLGTLMHDGKKIDVAAISSGMGCPSTEIIIHELYHLGAKRFLRIGTAGTLQPGLIGVGQLINVQASVRDDGTTRHYAPIEVPAIASLEFISSILLAAEKLGMYSDVHTGIVHCKSSLYARELGTGPCAHENQIYLNLLSESGVLATEMETATLFIQSQLYNYQLMQQGEAPKYRVLSGAILAIVSGTDNLEDSSAANTAIEKSINLALETVKILATQEML